MATLKMTGFSGELPKLMPRLLPDMSAQVAFNTRLDDGGLTPMRQPRRDFTFSGGSANNYRTLYRHDGDWLGWDSVVSAAPGPVAQDRLYYTGDGVPKMRVSGNVYPLAVPMPAAPLSGSVSGTGSGDVQTRIYTYTYVTSFGEESEPAGASNEVDWQPGQTVTLSGFASVPSGRSITHQRVYRSQTGASGGTDFYLIAERAASTSNFTDNVGVEDFGSLLPSTTWNAPPEDLSGLVAGPNGMMAAFRGKELYFCEPYRPHAWPEGYVLTTDYDIVGLGWFGTSMVVATTGTPYIVSGTTPVSMVMEKMELNLPCINPQSVQDLGYAVAYATHDGLVVVSPGGARVATELMISREQWLRMNPQTFVSGQYQGRYLASYRYFDASGEEFTGTIIIDLSGQQPFIIRSEITAEAFYYSVRESALYFLDDIGSVLEFDARGQVNEVQSWRSKEFVLPRPTNFGAIMVEVESTLTPEDIEAIEELAEQIRQENAQIIADGRVDGSINGAPLNSWMINGSRLKLPPTVSQFATVAVYADRKLVAVVTGTNRMQRLPSGFLARQWEVEVSGDMRVAQISLATTAAELMTI